MPRTESVKGKSHQRRRSNWSPSIGAAVFAKTTGRAYATANPEKLTPKDLAFLRTRISQAKTALWANKMEAVHLYDLHEALNVTQVLVDAGAAPEHAAAVAAATQMGAVLCARWGAEWNPVKGQLFAQVSELEVIHAGLDVYEDVLEAGLLGSELLLAMDCVKARQRAGQIIKVSACRPTT